MSTPQRKTLDYVNLRGRDGSTASVSQIPINKALEMLNVDLYRAAFGRKRGGAAALSLSGSGLTGTVSAAFRHVPSADDTAAELWLWDSTGAVARNAAGVWTNPTLKDALTGNAWDIQAASFNGKLFFAYKSAVDRLHCWDPTSGSIRRTGLAIPSAGPSVANTGAGTYAATQRWYRVRWTEQRSGSTVRRSEASVATAFTPSGSGTAARITQPTVAGEGETHWEVEASGTSSSGPWYVIATVVIATTTYDDSAAVTSYSGNTVTITAGNCTNWTSVQYLASDDNRVLGAGNWTSGNPVNTLWVSPVLGTTSSAFFDDETVPTATANAIQFNEKDSGYITGLGGPIDNQIIVLKNRQIWRAIPTGVAENPYRRKAITKAIGNLRHNAVVMAEDNAGNPTLYWLDQQGPYRMGPDGIARMVEDVKDLWNTFNVAATTVSCHGVFHRDLHQIWWWIAVNSENEPQSTKIVFDTQLGRVVEAGAMRDGWVKHTGDSAAARCSVMFSNTVGATMSRDLKPYIGQNGAVTRFWKCDTSDTDDAGTAFQAYIDLPDRHLGNLTHRAIVHQPYVLGSVGSQTLTITMTKDYGAKAETGTVTMSAVSDSAAETRIVKRVEGVESADVTALRVRVGDGSAISNTWTLDSVSIPYEQRESV